MDLNVYTKYSQKYQPLLGEQPFLEKYTQQNQYYIISSQAISTFYQIKIDSEQAPILIVPDGCIDIIFSYHSSQPSAYIFGSILNIQRTSLKPNTHYFGVRFLPSVIPDFVKASAEDIINNFIQFTDVVPDGENFLKKLNQSNNIHKQISLFLDTFSNQLKRKCNFTTDYIIETILHQRCDPKIRDLEKKTGYCSRHLQRIFKQDVGMSIKVFACIIRFQSAIHALTKGHTPRFSDLAYDLGYNDQAHFYKEFKKFSNMSPSNFIKLFNL